MKEHMYDRVGEQRWKLRLSRRPVCSCCRQPVDSELCLSLGCAVLCEGCISRHTRYTEDLSHA